MFSDRGHIVKAHFHGPADDVTGCRAHKVGMAGKAKSGKTPGVFGANLKVRRASLGLTIDMLVERSGVSRSYISSLETGMRANPSEGMAKRLAAALGCEVADLWGRDANAFEARALMLIRAMPEDRQDAAIAALYGLASINNAA